MHPVYLKPGEARPVHFRLQPGQLPQKVRSSKQGFSLVASERSAEADKDRCQGHKPLKKDDLPDGGGRRSW